MGIAIGDIKADTRSLEYSTYVGAQQRRMCL